MDKFSGCVKHTTSLEYIDLSENVSSPWKVYCAIIRHCHSNILTLCGDEGIQAHAKEIMDNLQRNTTLQSLTLLGYMTVKSAIVIDGKLFFGTPSTCSDDGKKTSDDNKRAMDVKVKILCHGDHEYPSEIISISKESIKVKIFYNHLSEGNGTSVSKEVIDLDTLYLMSLGLYNNTTIKILDLSCK